MLSLGPNTYRVSCTNSTHGFILRKSGNSIHSTLGFTTDTPQVTEYVGLDAIRLGGTQTIQLSVPGLGIQSNGVIGTSSDILEVIPISVLTGQTQSYTPAHGSSYRISTTVVTSITIELKDENQRLVDFHGSQWFVSLYLSFRYAPLVVKPLSLFDSPLPTQPTPLETQPTQKESKELK